MKKNKKRGMKLFVILTAFSIIPLVVAVLTMSTISANKIQASMENETREKLYVVAANLATHCQDNNLTYATASNYNNYIDSLKDQGVEMAIIFDGSPAISSIMNESEYRVREIGFDKDFTADKELLMKGYYTDEVAIEDELYYGYYMPIQIDGNLIAVAFACELKEGVRLAVWNIKMSFLGVVTILIGGFTLMGVLGSKKIAKSFLEVNKTVDALSQGDLSEKKMNKSSIREINVILAATENMQKNVSEIIGKVQEVSDKLVENIKDVAGVSEESAGRAKQITFSVGELARATTEMAGNVQGINDQMFEIDKCVTDISESVGRLNTSTENMLSTNSEAAENMNIILDSSEKSVNAVNQIANQIYETNESINEISTVVDLILSIAEQSSLLSLNASIEAARAGEQGRGFAVVADEINKLSGQSAEGAEKIRQLAEVIIEKSGKSVELVSKVHEFISSEQENINVTQEKYHGLSKEIDESANQIKAIAEKTDYLAEYKAKVVDNVQDLSAISEENAASNEEVNANIEEILVKIETINKSCEDMSQMAEELEESIKYFHE